VKAGKKKKTSSETASAHGTSKPTSRPKSKPKLKSQTKTDRRILRTRDALGDALVALMHEKNFDQITVQQVLDRAGVGRATFYAHYRDKEDLFMSDVEDFFAMAASMLKRHHVDTSRLAPIRELFSHMRDAKEFYMALVVSGKANDVRELGRGIFARSIDERIEAAGVQLDPLQRSAQAHALAGSMFSLLDWWIDKGMKADPQELDQLFHRMAWKGLEQRCPAALDRLWSVSNSTTPAVSGGLL
jgi:AcrR family transcriptional regulator